MESVLELSTGLQRFNVLEGCKKRRGSFLVPPGMHPIHVVRMGCFGGLTRADSYTRGVKFRRAKAGDSYYVKANSCHAKRACRLLSRHPALRHGRHLGHRAGHGGPALSSPDSCWRCRVGYASMHRITSSYVRYTLIHTIYLSMLS